MLYVAEYKRRQAPPGVKISSKNFGRDRRYPIVNKFREELAPQKGQGPAAATAAARSGAKGS
jgi:NAD+ synthase